MRRALTLLLPLAAGASLAGCSDYYGRGYGGVAVGVGAPAYHDADYFGYYGDYPYWGWYDGFYYPGSGAYVYDRYRRPHSWAPYQNYWAERRSHWQNNPQWRYRQQGFRDNWQSFRQSRSGAGYGRRGGPGAVSGGRHGRGH